MAKAISLLETPFVVVDIETTGSLPGKHAITEIAAVRVLGGEIQESFSQLVNPKQPIPQFIQKLTGITSSMVALSPTIEQVLPDFMAFLGDALFVAHHAVFDFQFIDAMAHKILKQRLLNPQLCTVRLARKLLPELKKKNLDSVTQHFGISITDRHRALGDAEATAKVLIEYLKMLPEFGVTTQARLLEFQKRGGKRFNNSKVPFAQERLAEFPQAPGVYCMYSSRGEILYIGKAKNLKKRLQSYFYNLLRQPTKVQELMPQVFDITTQAMGSELEALLEEAYLIKKHQPYYNRMIKNYKRFPFLKMTQQKAFPCLSTSTELETDGALYFGPFHKKNQFAPLVESFNKIFQLRSCSETVFQRHQALNTPCMAFEVGTCSGPCVGKISREDYQGRVQEIIQFFEGQSDRVIKTLEARRDHLAEELAYEKAHILQKRIMGLLKLQQSAHVLAKAVHQMNHIIVLPDRVAGRWLLLYVVAARIVFKQIMDPQLDSVESILERVRYLKTLVQTQSAVGSPQRCIPQEELEEVRIMTHWLAESEDSLDTPIWGLAEPYELLEKKIRSFFCTQLALPLWPELRLEGVFVGTNQA